MYGREELVTYISCEIYNKKTREFYSGEVLLKDEADKVMDAMEARIKELEEANKLAVIVGNQQAGRIKELELALSNSREHEKCQELKKKLTEE